GRIAWAQLKRLGVSDSTIHTWERDGYLTRVLPRVYAIGHAAPSREADLWAAILYAGPGGMLSHATAAHWRGLINHPPRVIEVTTPRKTKSITGVRVYARRDLKREFHHRLAVTSIAQTMVDLAATSDPRLVRRALAVLDYRHELDVDALYAMCRHGRPGSAGLRQALQAHQPQLAHTNGPLEEAFLEWCERWKVPILHFNMTVHGVIVDAYWPAAKLVVELDGHDNHSSAAQLRRDKRNDLRLRGEGLTVHRYDWTLLHHQPRQIRDEILAGLRRAPAPARPAPSAPPRRRRRPGPASPPPASG
ncbi:MAG TPA: DUF559 domain-containing protein, partial [Solirubrobacteraceae bacterium]